jgi:uncharacterized protein YkwD
MGVRTWLGCLAIASTTVTAQAQSYYYYPSSSRDASTVGAGAYWTPVYYYWPTGYGRQPVWYSYSNPYYQTAYTPLTYQASYTPQYYETAYTQQTDQPASPAQDAPDAKTHVTQASYAATEAAPAASETTVPVGDPYGFTSWLNATRAAYGLPAVGYDPNLASWAAVNNSHQASYGIGHFVMGPARRQNSAMGGFPGIESMWLASPAHASALLDPTIRWIGIAGLGAYWTFNAY